MNLPGETNAFLNENLCLYYKKLWSKCKRLWGAGHISAFWIRNGSLRIKLFNESLSMIPHGCDLEKLFPGNPLIEDNQLLIDYNIFCCVNKCFKIKLQNITLGKVPLYYYYFIIFFTCCYFLMLLTLSLVYSYIFFMKNASTEAATQKFF